MPYKNKDQDRRWHKLKMRERRAKLRLEGTIVTPSSETVQPMYILYGGARGGGLTGRVEWDRDGEGNPIYDD